MLTIHRGPHPCRMYNSQNLKPGLKELWGMSLGTLRTQTLMPSSCLEKSKGEKLRAEQRKLHQSKVLSHLGWGKRGWSLGPEWTLRKVVDLNHLQRTPPRTRYPQLPEVEAEKEVVMLSDIKSTLIQLMNQTIPKAWPGFFNLVS